MALFLFGKTPKMRLKSSFVFEKGVLNLNVDPLVFNIWTMNRVTQKAHLTEFEKGLSFTSILS